MRIFQRLGIWTLMLSATSIAHPTSPVIRLSSSHRHDVDEWEQDPEWWTWLLATGVAGLSSLTIIDSKASDLKFCLTLSHKHIDIWEERVETCCKEIKIPGKVCRPLFTRAISKSKARMDRQTAARDRLDNAMQPRRGTSDGQSDNNKKKPLAFSLEPLRDSLNRAASKIGGAMNSVNVKPMPFSLPVRGGFRLPAGALKKRDTKEVDRRPGSRKNEASKDVHLTEYQARGFPASFKGDANLRSAVALELLVGAVAVNAYAAYLNAGDNLLSCISTGVSLASASPIPSIQD
ncbi:MAG: hypothetical protein M1816_004877 [Peltula sp. TS41687]|nr:MAG: hypothetical protein M1816_004877 [Peltula sp. TS41687]